MLLARWHETLKQIAQAGKKQKPGTMLFRAFPLKNGTSQRPNTPLQHRCKAGKKAKL